ncbi:hypothetical protein GGX14DRAFT_401411 [Mycena pura]|uniref:Uncharacterized protein n=1 Tax=Mycena pura TaxID=153505 RepID=A0AAD6V4G2_9AGAR|nr:hypothetical protein GGX14DRAFT_401411 [Mycena pura]
MTVLFYGLTQLSINAAQKHRGDRRLWLIWLIRKTLEEDLGCEFDGEGEDWVNDEVQIFFDGYLLLHQLALVLGLQSITGASVWRVFDLQQLRLDIGKATSKADVLELYVEEEDMEKNGTSEEKVVVERKSRDHLRPLCPALNLGSCFGFSLTDSQVSGLCFCFPTLSTLIDRKSSSAAARLALSNWGNAAVYNVTEIATNKPCCEGEDLETLYGSEIIAVERVQAFSSVGKRTGSQAGTESSHISPRLSDATQTQRHDRRRKTVKEDFGGDFDGEASVNDCDLEGIPSAAPTRCRKGDLGVEVLGLHVDEEDTTFIDRKSEE